MSEPVEVYPFFTPSFLSQWHRAFFSLHGHDFVCAEQWMMYRKAQLFGDEAMAARILSATAPHDHKRMGQNVRGFVADVWDAEKHGIVFEGNLAKFGQNAGLRKKLLATGDALLVEANPKDFIWGAGLSADDPDIEYPSRWLGQNLLGYILTDVRGQLAQA